MMNLVAGFFGGAISMIVVSLYAQNGNIDPLKHPNTLPVQLCIEPNAACEALSRGTVGGSVGRVTIPMLSQAIMAGEKPNGDASVIKVDNEGRVICSMP